ncbi:MAG: T9SS type A sorting domain-containing protein, partial [Fibrobacteres bacterium]|nr:T9SS type A sorting domain-containing protein [Fibrobacterota bacterium]
NDVRPKTVFNTIMAVDTGDNIVALGDTSAYGGFYKLTFTMKCDPSIVNETGTTTRGVLAGTTVHRSGASDPAWYNTGVAAPNTDSIENLYANFTPNKWYKMDPPKMPNKSRDWSTLAFDPNTDNVLIWGGGHSAYCGSEVSHYTMGKDRWSIGYEPEQMLNLNGDGGNSGYHADYFTFNNRPFMPGHTRKAYCYSTVHKRMIAHNYGTKYTYLYDPVKMDYDTVRILRPAATPRSTTGYCVNDTKHGVFMWIGGGDFYLLDSTKVWKKLFVKNGTKAPSYYDLDAGSSYDSKRDRVLMVSKGAGIGKVWAYSFADSTLTSYTPSGAYNSVNSFWRDPQYLPDCDMLFVGGDSSSSLYDCTKNEWAVLKTVRGTGVISTITGSNAAYTYDPKRKLVIAINTGWNSMHVYVMKVSADSIYVSADKGVFSNNELVMRCFPVPFNPVSKVSLNLPNMTDVNLTVTDLSGKVVKRIMSGKMQAGVHQLSWNGTDDAGNKLSSAVYILKLKAGNSCITKKTLLTK